MPVNCQGQTDGMVNSGINNPGQYSSLKDSQIPVAASHDTDFVFA